MDDFLERFERQSTLLLQYETLTDDEKRELLGILGSNFSSAGKSVVFALRSPYREMAEVVAQHRCGHLRNDVRTRKLAELLKGHASNDNTSQRDIAA